MRLGRSLNLIQATLKQKEIVIAQWSLAPECFNISLNVIAIGLPRAKNTSRESIITYDSVSLPL